MEIEAGTEGKSVVEVGTAAGGGISIGAGEAGKSRCLWMSPGTYDVRE